MSAARAAFSVRDGVAARLISATAISALSFLLHDLLSVKGLVASLIIAYIPLALGVAAMWLCFSAIRKTAHKLLVIAYSVVLAPFAFNYPAWLAILWMLYSSGRYAGPMP